MVRRMVLWRGLDEWTAEAARVEIGDDGLRATGTQLGAHRLPYRLDYALDATGRATAGGFVTRHLRVAIAGDGWRRSIDLLRGDDGEWRCGAETEGAARRRRAGRAGPAADGRGRARPAGARLRSRLLAADEPDADPPSRALDREPGERTPTMAWVSVPDLAGARRRAALRAPGAGACPLQPAERFRRGAAARRRRSRAPVPRHRRARSDGAPARTDRRLGTAPSLPAAPASERSASRSRVVSTTYGVLDALALGSPGKVDAETAARRSKKANHP